MEFEYNLGTGLGNGGKDKITYNLKVNELSFSNSFELSKSKYFPEEVTNVISELMGDNFSKVNFSLYCDYYNNRSHHNEFEIKYGNVKFGRNQVNIKLTHENKEKFAKFVEYLKPNICVKNIQQIIELSKLEPSMFPICVKLSNGNRHIFHDKDELRYIDYIEKNGRDYADEYSIEELQIMKKYMESENFSEDKKETIICDSFGLVKNRNCLWYDNSGSVIFDGIDDKIRVSNFIKCLDILINK